MTRQMTFIAAAAIVFGTATATSASAKAQQWGPPAQSSHYHKPAAQDTLTAYNTAVQRPSAPSSVRPQATRPASPAVTVRRAVPQRARSGSTAQSAVTYRIGQ